MTCSQIASTAASVHWPQTPPGLGPPGTFHVAAPPTAPHDCLAWHHLPLALAANGWVTAAAPASAPAWDMSQPSLTLKLRAGKQPIRLQSSLAAVLEEEEGKGPSPGLGAEPGPPVESQHEERPWEPWELGEQVCSPGSPAPVRGSTGATSWTHSWEISSKVLKSQGSRVASPEFQLCLPGGREPTKFVLVLSTDGEGLGPGGLRGRSSFKKAKGRGIVSIKCKGGPLATSAFGIALWLEGGGQARQLRDPVRCSFAERSMHEHESWQFQAGPGQTKITVGVQLTVETSASEHCEAVQACPGGPEPAWSDAGASSAAEGLHPGPPPGLRSFEATGSVCCGGAVRAHP